MTYSNDDWRKAITNLIKKTSKKEISWQLTDIFEADVWTEVDRSLMTKINDKIYVVSQTRKRNYIDEEEYYWVNDVNFSIFQNARPRHLLIASAPSDLNVVASLFFVAEASFAFESDALGGLLD